MNKRFLPLILLVLSVLLSHGCTNQSANTAQSSNTYQSTNTTVSTKTSSDEKAGPIVQTDERAEQTEKKTEEEPEYPIKPFTEESLYDLLVGELAGLRNNFNVAQERYLAQARQTRDPGVVERAAQISAYTNNKPALLEMALLWIEIAPQDLNAHSLASMSLTQHGRYEEAFPHAVFSLKNGVNESLMNLVISANKASKEQRNQLLQQFPALEREMPDNQFLLLSKAMLLRQQELLPEALGTANQLLSLNPSIQPAIMLKAQLLHRLGKKQEASTFLKQALANIPNSKRMRLQYARFLADDDLEGAHKQLSILAKQYPNDPDLLFSLALASKGLKYEEEAKQLFTQLTQYPITAYSAHFELGVLAEKDNDIEAVQTHYRKVRSGPKFLPATVRLSKFMTQQGQLDEARLYLQKLRLEHPQQSAALYQIESELLSEQQLLDEAYDVLSNAISRDPNNIQLLYMRSLLSEQQNNFAQSEQDLRAILAKDSDNAMALNALGYTLTLHTDRYEEAHKLIVRALELNPGDPATIDSLGWVFYRLGNYEEAIKHLREALSKLPDPEVAAHLGEVLWVTGEQEEATSVWQKVLEKDPDNAIIRETMERLNAK